MLTARARHGLVMVLVVAPTLMLATRPARSDCGSGASEGFDQCQKYPACQCQSKTVVCPAGGSFGWYTQYSVSQPCGSPSPGPAPSPSGQPDATVPSDDAGVPVPTPCDMMRKWLSEEKNILGGYQDPGLVGQASASGFSLGGYHDLVWLATHPDMVPPDSPALMWTDADCAIQNEAFGCKWLVSQGLPQAACQIAKDHENVHVAQCKNASHAASIYDLAGGSQREVQAHQNTVSEIDKWIHDHCGS